MQSTQQFAHNTIFGLGISFSFLAILAVTLRFYCRVKVRAGIGADDWLILPALVTALGSVATGFAALYPAHIGEQFPKTGHGPPDHNPPVIISLNKVIYASSIILMGPLTFAKLSVLLFYRRIFSTPRFRIPFLVVFALVSAWGIAFTTVFLAQCVPVSDFWETKFTTQPSRCVAYSFNEAFAYTNVFIDIAVLSLPVPMVLRLQMSTSRKVAVLSIFMLGAIVVGIGIAKTVAFYALFKVVLKDGDPTYDDAGFFYYIIPEACLSVVAACLPTLSPLFTKRSLASIIGSLRSAISLSSLRSSRTQKSDRNIGSLDPRGVEQNHQTEIFSSTNAGSHDEIKSGSLSDKNSSDRQSQQPSIHRQWQLGHPQRSDSIFVMQSFSSEVQKA